MTKKPKLFEGHSQTVGEENEGTCYVRLYAHIAKYWDLLNKQCIQI